MCKNHSSIVVLRIRPKFWWMLPMGLRDKHTKYEAETQRWQPRTATQNQAFFAQPPPPPLGPSHCTICPQNRPQKAPKSPRICAHRPPAAPNQKRTISRATWLRADLIHPQPPSQTPKMPSKWAVLGQKNGSKMGQKGFFPKMILDHLGCPNGHMSPFVAHCKAILAPPGSQNASKMGCFAAKNRSKMGQKCVFPKMPFLSPLQAILAPPESPNALKMGCFGTKNQSKMDQKCVFPKILLDYLGCTNKWNEPISIPC